MDEKDIEQMVNNAPVWKTLNKIVREYKEGLKDLSDTVKENRIEYKEGLKDLSDTVVKENKITDKDLLNYYEKVINVENKIVNNEKDIDHLKYLLSELYRKEYRKTKKQKSKKDDIKKN